MTGEPPPLPCRCRHCGKALRPGRGDSYLVRVEAVADPAPPTFDADDLARDPRPEIERLLERLRTFTERELEDQVCRRLTLHLCIPCYSRWIADTDRGPDDCNA